MDNTSSERASRADRSRLAERGLARFEVLGRDADRELIRSLARRLSEDGPEAAQLHRTLTQAVAETPIETVPSQRGGVFAALRRSPLVGANLDLRRLRVADRDIDL